LPNVGSGDSLLSGVESAGAADGSGSAASIRRLEQRAVDGALVSANIEATLSGRFYEDLFVKPFLIAASMGGTSWAPHEGA
jgi:hypothetical protein